ncbi:hypothetical protein EON66_08805 [archaeon]|nr:MAG: hypothetical protein EON66_08805 [archaeon]
MYDLGLRATCANHRVPRPWVQMKELQLIDLTKQLGDMNARLKQFAAMYEVVKTERNTFANNIQAASQTIAEMRERIKILHNEVDILQNESTAKDKALAKERQAHGMAAAQRDGTARLPRTRAHTHVRMVTVHRSHAHMSSNTRTRACAVGSLCVVPTCSIALGSKQGRAAIS